MPSALAAALPRLLAQAPFVPLGTSGGGVRCVGRGPARLVVLPGLVGTADALAGLGEALADTHHTALVTWPRVDGLDALLAWLETVRGHLGGGPLAVYGGSFGGLVAQDGCDTRRRSSMNSWSQAGPPTPRATKNQRLL
jgi:pimeloyl-ACP methyl ester carboxylesterase